MTIFKKIMHRTLTHHKMILMFVFFLAPGIAFAANGQSAVEEFLLWILSLFAWLAGVMGAFMGTVIYETIVKMGVHVHDLSAINLAWGMFRDLGNIFLVFGFITIGIATILDNASYGAKKALPKLLIVALTLNFSLFVAEFIVDTGNMFATQFYTQISGGKLPVVYSASTEPITSAIFTALKLTTIYNEGNPGATSAISAAQAPAAPQAKAPKTTGAKINPNAAVATSAQTSPQSHWFIIFFMGILLYIITAFVLGAIAILLVVRFVVLLFLLIVSPIGFVGLAGIPLLSTYGKKWWQALSDQTLLAPILLLLLLVVTTLAQGGIFTNNDSYASAFSGANVTSIANLLLEFAVIIGLLLASLIIAKSLSGKAASFATKMNGKAVFGGLGRVGRGTLGWGAQRASEKIRGTKLARIPILGRRITSGIDRVATSSFDLRAGKTGNALRSTGISTGDAQKGGYRASEKASIEKELAYGRTLELTEKEKAETEDLKGQRAGMQIAASNNNQTYEKERDSAEKQHVEKLKEIDDAITTKMKEMRETPTIAGGEDRAKERQADLQKLQNQRAEAMSGHSDSVTNKQKEFDSKREQQEQKLKEIDVQIKEREGTKSNPNKFAQKEYAQKLGSKNTAGVAIAGTGGIAAAAAVAGAAVGTAALPGIGTAIGAVVAGTAAGGVLGKAFGSKWREKASKALIKEVGKSENELATDRISHLLAQQVKLEKSSQDTPSS